MHGPFPPAIGRSDIYISGDVTIEDRATIGPGVVLQATLGSRLIIRAGVCLGAGAVIQAHQGLLEIQADAIVGARALIIGAGTVGAAACLGSESTTISPNIAPEQAVANGALVGAPVVGNSPAPARSDNSNGSKSSKNNGSQPELELEDVWGEPETAATAEPLPRSLDPIGLQAEPKRTAPQGDRNGSNNRAANSAATPSNTTNKDVSPTETSGQPKTKDNGLSSSGQKEEEIIGRTYVRQLMVTLFPHKKKQL